MEDKLIAYTQQLMAKNDATPSELKNAEDDYGVKKRKKEHKLQRENSSSLIEELELKRISKQVEIIADITEENEYRKTIPKHLRREAEDKKLHFLTKILEIKENFFHHREEATKYELATQYGNNAREWLKNYNSEKNKPRENSTDSEPISPEKQATLNYLNNLIVEAAKIKHGDYSSLSVEKFHSPNSLKTAKNKVLRGEIDYSEAELNALDSQEKVEKKLAQVVDAVFYYVGHLKGGSGQPAEAQEILENSAQLLKEEVTTKVEALGENTVFTDLFPQQPDLAKTEERTSDKNFVDDKKETPESVKSSDVTKNNQKTSQTPVLDENEATNISENQAPEASTSTNIPSTKKNAGNNSLPQRLIDLDKYKNL
ncbi:10788_t:CDS:2 [Paraglomus occultum]|uniref:10788_t:CDS:1 n=1 Tax=Paraglomus occultum TaxID=144539 RepID=A0A9N9ARH1_9GLOM|nr:10788_t:CDS:2 [Paraglomus occultum]